MKDYWFVSYTWDMPGVHTIRRPFSSKIISVHPFLWLQEKNKQESNTPSPGKTELLGWNKLADEDVKMAENLGIVPKPEKAPVKKKK